MTTRDDEGPAPAAQDGGTKEPAGHVTVLRQGERAIHIVGTAHVSRSSVEEVGHVIAQLRPHTVCVELCQTRYEALTDEARWRKLDIFQVIKQKKALYLLASLALQAYQQRLGARLGVRPGAELLAAIAAAEAVGAAVVLADRNIQTTLKRTWGNLSFWSKSKLLGALLASAFDREQVTEEQIEALKDSDYVSDLMAE
ncbi:MAG: TraB/GumN family protein, partial [Deltaproteobacteria bacterium]|nr:TraB/GumN family protein [Deltaproteobacteria bacterium]